MISTSGFVVNLKIFFRLLIKLIALNFLSRHMILVTLEMGMIVEK